MSIGLRYIAAVILIGVGIFFCLTGVGLFFGLSLIFVGTLIGISGIVSHVTRNNTSNINEENPPLLIQSKTPVSQSTTDLAARTTSDLIEKCASNSKHNKQQAFVTLPRDIKDVLFSGLEKDDLATIKLVCKDFYTSVWNSSFFYQPQPAFDYTKIESVKELNILLPNFSRFKDNPKSVFSNQAERVALVHESYISIWDTETGKLIKILIKKEARYDTIQFVENSRFIIAYNKKNAETIDVWDIENEQIINPDSDLLNEMLSEKILVLNHQKVSTEIYNVKKQLISEFPINAEGLLLSFKSVLSPNKKWLTTYMLVKTKDALPVSFIKIYDALTKKVISELIIDIEISKGLKATSIIDLRFSEDNKSIYLFCDTNQTWGYQVFICSIGGLSIKKNGMTIWTNILKKPVLSSTGRYIVAVAGTKNNMMVIIDSRTGRTVQEYLTSHSGLCDTDLNPYFYFSQKDEKLMILDDAGIRLIEFPVLHPPKRIEFADIAPSQQGISFNN